MPGRKSMQQLHVRAVVLEVAVSAASEEYICSPSLTLSSRPSSLDFPFRAASSLAFSKNGFLIWHDGRPQGQSMQTMGSIQQLLADIVQIFIVTGASSGIGLATCNKLLAAGAKVFGTDVAQEPESLSNHKQGGTFAFHQGNLTKPSVPEDVVSATLSTFKSEHIDGLLNVAGIIDAYQAADTVDDDTWERVIAVNLTAPLKMTRAAIPAIRKSGKGGVILNVASKAGTSGGASGIAYTSSKHGLVSGSES